MEELNLYPFLAAWIYDEPNIIAFSPQDQDTSDKFEVVRGLSDPHPETEGWDYFIIQRSTYIDDEEDLLFSLAHIELDSQSNGNYYDLKRVIFFPHQIKIDFGTSPFMSKYSTVAIHFTRACIPCKIVGFFANGLYLGDRITYSNDFPDKCRVEQTEYPEIDKEITD